MDDGYPGRNEFPDVLIYENSRLFNDLKDVVLVDTRSQQEYETLRIKGAVNIPINALEKKMDSLPADKTIVFFCGTAGRAGEAYDMVQMFKSGLKTYFLNAEIEFNDDGSYSMKELES